MTRALTVATALVLAVPSVAGCISDPGQTPDWTGVPVIPSLSLDNGVPAGDPLSQKVTYDFAVPAKAVTIINPTPTPNPAPQPSLPYLVGVYTADRAAESPGYQRVLFFFRGGFPSYQFGYVDQVLTDGPPVQVDEDGMIVDATPTGEPPTPVPMTGTTFVQLTFFNAQAHDRAKRSTVTQTPPDPTALTVLRSAVQVSDASGRLRYGLGIEAGQPLPLRVGEATYGDGAGGTFSVVWVDVRTG
jgi:hypothetical protein